MDQESIIFPKIKPTAFYAFPKICKDAKCSLDEITCIMKNIHLKDSSSVCTSEFSKYALSCIFGQMNIGQYYQPLPRSNSADALIRLNDNSIINIQYKNLQNPITSAIIKSERRKALINGWNCYLLIICPSGHYKDSKEDLIIEKNDSLCKTIVLSRLSVKRYLGNNTVHSIESFSLLSDLMDRSRSL